METDLVIVGAGPVGLYGAYYAGFRGLRVVLIDTLSEPGGQITAMYPEKLIYDIAGFPAVRGRDLVDGLVQQAAPFSPVYVLGEAACGLARGESGLTVLTSAGREIRTGGVVITGGIGTFSPRPLPAGQDFAGHGLRYFVPQLDVCAEKDVVIVGGGDSAFDWAQALHPIANRVTLVHRSEKFRAHAHTVSEVKRSPVEILTNCEITALHGNGAVEAVDVVHHPTSTVRRLPAHEVIAALGFDVDLGPLKEWGLQIQARRIVVSTNMLTNLDRVYAAGDIVSYPGKVRLISVGFGEVATAVNNAAAEIAGLAVFPGHSTEAGL